MTVASNFSAEMNLELQFNVLKTRRCTCNIPNLYIHLIKTAHSFMNMIGRYAIVQIFTLL